MKHSLADEMFPSIAMDYGRIETFLRGVCELLRDEAPVLHPRHIFIDDKDRVTIEDGPREAPYAAPEAQHTYASCVFAIGVMLRELLGERAGLPEMLVELARACTDPDPARRPSFEAVGMRLVGWAPMTDHPREWQQPFVPTAPTEVELVAALRANPSDAATRAVYADWLEEHGFEQRAKFLHLDVSPQDLDIVQHHQRSVLGKHDAMWRAVAGGAARVVDCAKSGCPARWDAMAPTKHDNLRRCGACNRNVAYCTSLGQANLHAAVQRDAVVPDAALDRAAVLKAVAPPPFEAPFGGRTWNPPPPGPFPTPEELYPSNPPPPGRGGDDGVLGRFFGWFKKKR